MTDTPFIVAGWLGTAGAIAIYTVSIMIRTRRATRPHAENPRRPR